MTLRPFFSIVALASACLAASCAVLLQPTLRPARVNRLNAVHEAGHAVMRSAYFGAESIIAIHIHPFAGDGTGHDHAGVVSSKPTVFNRPSVVRRYMVSSSAGIAAEKIIMRSPRLEFAIADMVNARDYAWWLFTRRELRPRSTVYDRATAPEHIVKRVEWEIESAKRCANVMVAANAELIIAVANLLERQPVVEMLKSMPMDEFVRLMQRTPPVVVCDPYPRGWP